MGGDCFYMSRFFVDPGAVRPDTGTITITGEDVKHIRNVLRNVPGDALMLSDCSGTDYHVTIEQMEKDSILTRIVYSEANKTEPPVKVTLFQGIPKADKMDHIIQKCVELGVHRIVPVITARTVVRFEKERDAAAKTTRWQRIALEAAKQCDRGSIPMVEEPVRFNQALKLAESCLLRLFPYEEETTGNLRQYFMDGQKTGTVDNIALFIGPEGGFAPEETAKAAECGFMSVTLGPRILRTETAGMAVLAVIMYELGDMNCRL